MKKILCLLLPLLVLSAVLRAQSSASEQLSQRMAQRMKDSLNLSDGQRDQLYTVNQQLSAQKLALRAQMGASDSLGFKIQAVEKTRDSLYRPLLTVEQFQRYREKKSVLISSH